MRMRVRAILIVFAAVLAGCSGTAASRDELVNGARSLVPAGSSVVEEVEGDCVELAPSPSCVHIYFFPREKPIGRRTKAVEKAAGAAGWERGGLEAFPGGNIVHYRRDGLGATVYLRADDLAESCRRHPQRDCADAVMVE